MIDPKKFTVNTNKPPVILTDFQIDGKSVHAGENSVLKQSISIVREITLFHDISGFGFEFSALNYTVSKKNRYAYKMDGFDKDWTYTGSDKRIARYTNLDPGEYIFRVKGSNNDGVWNEEGTSVKIIILPPWWRTWWFRIFLAILLIALFFGTHIWRMYLIKQRNILLEKEITERTEKLRKSEEQFRVIFEKSPISIELYDAKGELTYLNQACLDMFGISDPVCVTGFKLFENPNFHRPYKDKAMTGEAVRFESLYDFEPIRQMNLFHTCKTGTFYVDALVTPLSDDRKTIFGYMVQIQDITERKHAEDLIRKNERLMSDIINFLPDATFVIDKYGKVITWNKAMETMTGIAAKDILGKGNYEYAIPFYGKQRPILIDLALQAAPDIEKTYNHIQRCGDNMNAEHYYPDLQGKKAWLFGNACVLRDSKGEIIGAIESIRDITKRKSFEIELKHAKEKAETAERIKNTFLANVSHHLRTPLNSVLGFSEIMADDKTLSEKYQEYAAIIRRSGKNLLALINQMLEVSKLNSDLLSSDPRYQHLLNLLESNDIQAETSATEDHLSYHETLEIADQTEQELIRSEIRKIPSDLSERLSQAAKSLDINEMLDIIAKIRLEYPSAADALEQLANRFEYEKIIELIEDI